MVLSQADIISFINSNYTRQDVFSHRFNISSKIQTFDIIIFQISSPLGADEGRFAPLDSVVSVASRQQLLYS